MITTHKVIHVPAPLTFMNKTVQKLIIAFEDLSDEFQTRDANIAKNIFVEKASNAIRLVTESKTLRVREFKKLNHGLLMDYLLQLNIGIKWIKRLLLDYNIVNKYRCKAYRNNLSELLNKCKNDYYKNKTENSKIFRLISDSGNEKSEKNNKSKNQIKNGNNSLSNNKEMAHYCNHFFCEYWHENVQPNVS